LNQKKNRLDKALLDRGLASTRSKAQELIRDGHVLLRGKPCKQTGKIVEEGDAIEILKNEHPFVSRGGVKLEGALAAFSIEPEGKRVLDIGQSTGGFTDCLLHQGASSIVGIEVGHSQLDPKLRGDPRVRCLEKTDIRLLDPDLVAPRFSLVVIDLSFISLNLVLPAVCKFLDEMADVIALVKPQFELDSSKVGGGGIVRREEDRLKVIEVRKRFCEDLGFTVAGEFLSSITGGDGNQETFLHLKWHSSKIEN
jgi:23S rRNA (cytidine1920-2'-O)/16S rRNA (cytidine1409-2'-O)-methyltransferase